MKQKETFEKFKGCTSELSCITECEAFSSGFILATRIMAEVMQGLEGAENMLQTTEILNYKTTHKNQKSERITIDDNVRIF